MKANIKALGRLKAGKMNKAEAAYNQHLQMMMRAGDVAWYKFEGVNLRLADKTFYKPDFIVMLADGRIQMHEVKGFWTDDARVKIKVAASMFPFEFIAIKKKGTRWETEEF